MLCYSNTTSHDYVNDEEFVTGVDDLNYNSDHTYDNINNTSENPVTDNVQSVRVESSASWHFPYVCSIIVCYAILKVLL